MEKRISYYEFQSVKSVAKAIDPHLRKQATIKGQIEKLAEEYEKEEKAIEALESGVVKVLGFKTSDLVKKVSVNTEKGIKTGYVTTDIVHYDDETKQFVITKPDENEAGKEEVPAEQPAPEAIDHFADAPDAPAESPAEEEQKASEESHDIFEEPQKDANDAPSEEAPAEENAETNYPF